MDKVDDVSEVSTTSINLPYCQGGDHLGINQFFQLDSSRSFKHGDGTRTFVFNEFIIGRFVHSLAVGLLVDCGSSYVKDRNAHNIRVIRLKYASIVVIAAFLTKKSHQKM
jgi:hypothetical protein